MVLLIIVCHCHRWSVHKSTGSRGSHGLGPFHSNMKSFKSLPSILLSSTVIHVATPRFLACTHTLTLCACIKHLLRHFTTFYCLLTIEWLLILFGLSQRKLQKGNNHINHFNSLPFSLSCPLSYVVRFPPSYL